MSLVWEQPPAAPPSVGRPKSEKWSNVAEMLKNATGKFARIVPLDDDDEPFDSAAKANGLANRIRKGQSKAFEPEGHFDAVARPLGNGENGTKLYGVWARHLGEDYEPDPVGDYAIAHSLAALKEQAKGRGLKVSGSRRALAERILDYDANASEPPEDDDE